MKSCDGRCVITPYALNLKAPGFPAVRFGQLGAPGESETAYSENGKTFGSGGGVELLSSLSCSCLA